jgi:hypothetical protein
MPCPGFVILDEMAVPVSGWAKRYWGTNWMIRPSFPVFVLNVLNCCGGGDPLDSIGCRPRMSILLASPSTLRVRTLSGKTAEAASRSDRAVLDKTEEVGIYEVQSAGTQTQTPKWFAVNLLDPTENIDLSPLRQDFAVHLVGILAEWNFGRF